MVTAQHVIIPTPEVVPSVMKAIICTLVAVLPHALLGFTLIQFRHRLFPPVPLVLIPTAMFVVMVRWAVVQTALQPGIYTMVDVSNHVLIFTMQTPTLCANHVTLHVRLAAGLPAASV